MSSLRTIEKRVLESLFQMGGGYVLDFTDRTIGEFFDDELGLDIFDDDYNYASGSKANRMRGFWKEAPNDVVARSINKLIEYIETKLLMGDFQAEDFPKDRIKAASDIADKLLSSSTDEQFKKISTPATISDNKISIILNRKVFSHVQGLLQSGHYFNAVEESYKIVREKLRSITGKEKAHEAFNQNNYKTIFGHEARTDAEKDFFEGVKFLHMAIQNLRNEKAHTPAKELDKNLAIHYIVLAGLAYDLIDRDNN